ncbi:hypothetical protein VFPBJ_05913 [Purpureocillium lilacinum]|uniref:2EXR domain-containing protein n=1 Tax=Purpureocillium lilacinum TaxID=33203 RepID=A0A179GS53_PURLI|nr:hypothetical protein VFPBJ_05913 [Purpureocillium lilacinum]
MTKTTSAMGFALFQRLPPELRREIWAEGLRAADQPTIYLYSWRWALPALVPETMDEEAVTTRYAAIEQRERLVEAGSVPPIAYVNTEARAVAKAWMKSNHMEMRSSGGAKKGKPTLVRPWDPSRDHLYVGRDQWEDFCLLPFEDTEAGEALAASIRHLALPAWTAYYSYEQIGMLLDFLPRLESLSVIWDKVPQLRAAEGPAPPGFRAGDANWADEDEDEEMAFAGDDTYGRNRGDFWAEVQPRWRLLPVSDTGWKQGARMAIVDPMDGKVSIVRESETVEDMMDEVLAALGSVELPEYLWDPETGDLTLAVRPVTAVRC